MIKQILVVLLAVIATTPVFAQNESPNAASKLLVSENKLTLGGYGQLDYNQPIDKELMKNGVLDVHRLVLLLGYKFNERTHFVTEIEFEHVNEVYVEQAFLNYKINKWLNFRGGLLLIPMGLVNEYHEPTTFNGVNRPMVDTKIIPSTWRELGAGFAGTLDEVSVKYQVYVVNGFNSYSNTALVNGSDALRKARQKGIKSIISTPDFAGRIDYFGLKGLSVGASFYGGKTQSSLYNNLNRNDAAQLLRADSSVLQMAMTAVDARYTLKGLRLRGQFVYAALGNTAAYNSFAKNAGTAKGIGSAMSGFYAEAAYNIFQTYDKINSELIPFVRYEKYNTQHKTDEVTLKNDEYNNTLLVTGIGWKITSGAMLKADVEFAKNKATEAWGKSLNIGIGVWF